MTWRVAASGCSEPLRPSGRRTGVTFSTLTPEQRDRAAGVLLGAACGDAHAGNHVWLGELVRWGELVAIDADRFMQRGRCEVRGKRIRQAELGCELRAEERGSQNVQRNVGSGTRGRLDRRHAGFASQVCLQFQHVVREGIGGRRLTAQGAQRGHIGARRAAQTKVNAITVDGGQGAELLSNHQRGVIREHDAAGAQADGFRVVGYVADDQRGGAGGDGWHVVVLGVPDTLVAMALSSLGQTDGGLE